MSRAGHPLLPLPAVDRGERATVQCLSAPAGMRARLQELGFLPGAEIEVLAPGTPCIVRLGRETRLCLRGDEADAVLVALA